MFREGEDQRLRKTPYTVLRAVIPSLLFEAMRANGDFSELVADGVSQARAFAVGRTVKLEGREFRDQFDPNTPLVGFPGVFAIVNAHVVASLFSMVARGTVDSSTLAKWSADVPQGDEWQPLRTLVDEAYRLFTTGADIWPAVRKPLYKECEHLLAALSVVHRGIRSPEQILLCHGVWAHYLKQRPLYELCEADVANLVSARWLGLCDRPALLVLPRLTVPEIREAVIADTKGWAKTKAVLNAAAGAVNSSAAATVRAAIDAIEIQVDWPSKAAEDGDDS